MRARSTWSVVILIIIVVSALAVVSIRDITQERPSACAYLASNYNSSVGLIAETPTHSRYFLYSDNFLAALVLPVDCNDSSLAQNINKTFSRYNASEFPNQFMAFNCKQFFQGSEDYEIAASIWSTVNNQTGAPLNSSYADIAFLQSYYDDKCAGNVGAAVALFNNATKMYDGIGFNDTAFQQGNSRGIYQTYKLALYIYVAKLLGQASAPSALADLMRMQASSGGFYTGYAANFSNDGTSTNTETTCLAILALDEK